MKIFNESLGAEIKSSAFDLSHERKMSMNMGDLVPCLCEEIVPGDKFKLNTEIMMRLLPLVAPMIHRVNVFTHFFFVPNRLIWDNWESFITGGVTGESTPVMPYISFDDGDPLLSPKTLADYLGISVVDTVGPNTFQVGSLPFRAYQLVFNEYYRDQTLNTEITIPKNDGSDTDVRSDLCALRKRCWEKDYFTSAMPWTQRGGDVGLPIVGTAPVVVTADALSGGADQSSIRLTSTGAKLSEVSNDPLYGSTVGDLIEGTHGYPAFYDPADTLETDLTNGSAVAMVEDLRRVTRLQMWLERNARAGSRYVEQILSHFRRRVPDYRLQRPEYLGGGKSPVVISEVLQTAETSETSPQGNLAGHGISVGNTHGFYKEFDEHGWLIGIISVLPKTAYQQGFRRHFMKTDKFDFYWPEFAQLGEQPVYVRELYNSPGETTADEVFGYQSRYCEYKYIPSSVHGDLKGNLDHWHQGRIFTAKPTLNSGFVLSDPTHRVFAVIDPDEHKLIVHMYHNLTAVRPLPYFNVPQL